MKHLIIPADPILPAIAWLEGRGFIVLSGRVNVPEAVATEIVKRIGASHPTYSLRVAAFRKATCGQCDPTTPDIEFESTPFKSKFAIVDTAASTGEEFMLRVRDCMVAEHPNLDMDLKERSPLDG